jgi:hypothetical protein
MDPITKAIVQAAAIAIFYYISLDIIFEFDSRW